MAWRSGQAYVQDLRDRVLAAAGSARVVAARFGVSVSYVVKARQRQREHPVRCRRARSAPTRPGCLAGLHDAILAHVEANADATVAELRESLQRQHGVSASMGLMWNTLHRLGLTLKKKRSAPPSRRVPMSPKRVVHGPNASRVSTQPD